MKTQCCKPTVSQLVFTALYNYLLIKKCVLDNLKLLKKIELLPNFWFLTSVIHILQINVIYFNVKISSILRNDMMPLNRYDWSQTRKYFNDSEKSSIDWNINSVRFSLKQTIEKEILYSHDLIQ